MTRKRHSQALGKNIRVRREKLTFSQEKLAQLAGLSRSGYLKIERGEVWPGESTLERLASALQVQVVDLFDFSGIDARPIEGLLQKPKRVNIKNLSVPDLLWIQYKLLNASVDIRSLVLGILLNDTSLLTDEVRRFLEKLDLSGFDKLAKAD